MALLGVIAIVASACGGVHRIDRPERRSRHGRGVRGGSRHADPAAGRHPAAARRRRARPQRRRRRPLVHRPRRRRPAAAAPGRGAVRQRLQRDAEGRLHRARDRRQQRRRADSSRPRSRPATRRTSSARSASRGSTSSATTCSTSRRSSTQDQLQTCRGVDPKLVDFFKHRRGRRHDRRAVRGLPVVPLLQQGPVRRGQAARTRRPRSASCTRASRGTWTPSATLGMKLTVDKNGNDATSAELRPDEHRPVGLRHAVRRQQPDGRDDALRAGLVRRRRRQDRPDPATRRDRREVVQRRRLEGPLHPDRSPDQQRPARQGQRVRVGQPGDERVAHAGSRAASTRPRRPSRRSTFGWAVAPSYNGVTTAKLHADTFSMLNTTKHPDEAFKALTALVASPELLTIYGAMPADPAQQDAFFKSIDKNFPGSSSTGPSRRPCSAYPDIPNHQSWVPNYAKAKAAWQAFQNKYRTTAGRRHRRRARHAEDDPPGHLRRAGHVGQRSSIHGPLGRPPARGGHPSTTIGAASAMTEIDRGPRRSAARDRPRAAGSAPPGTPRGALGLRLHRTVADRPRAVHGRPDDRLAGHVVHRLRPAPSRERRSSSASTTTSG